MIHEAGGGSGERGQAAVRQVLLNDSSIREVIKWFDEITLALVEIGTVEPSPLLASSGNIFSDEEPATFRDNGAVGDISSHDHRPLHRRATDSGG